MSKLIHKGIALGLILILFFSFSYFGHQGWSKGRDKLSKDSSKNQKKVENLVDFDHNDSKYKDFQLMDFYLSKYGYQIREFDQLNGFDGDLNPNYLKLINPQIQIQTSESVSSSDWPTAGYDQQRTGYNDKENILNPPLQLNWTYNKAGNQFIESLSVVDDTIVMVGSNDTNYVAWAINTTTHTEKWSYSFRDGGVGTVGNVPTISNGMVFVGGQNDDELTALNFTTGEKIWDYTGVGTMFGSHALVYDDFVYVKGDGKIYAIYINGTKIWDYPVSGQGRGSPSVFNNTVYVSGSDGDLWALNAKTGSLLWNRTNTPRYFTHPIVTNGLVIVDYNLTLIRAFDATTGALAWSANTYPYNLPQMFQGMLASANGILYATTVRSGDNATIFAIDVSDGSILWSTEIPSERLTTTPSIANDYVYFYAEPQLNQTSPKKVYALDETTGNIVWNQTANLYGNGRGVIANGFLYFPARENGMVAYNSVNPSLLGPISITSNDDFELYASEGDGSEENPYIIEDYNITDNTQALIDIQDTDAYFVLRENYLNGINLTYPGISLTNVSNGLIFNNTILNTDIGIYSSNSDFNVIDLNDVYSNNYGINFDSSSVWSNITRNIVHLNTEGIIIDTSDDIRIMRNIVYNNSLNGINLIGVERNNVFTNEIFGMSVGLKISGTSLNNSISSNNISWATNYGIKLDGNSNSNFLFNNTIENISNIGLLNQNSNNNYITSNIINNASAQGIRIVDSYGLNIHSNVLMDNSYGMLASGTNTSIWFNNTIDSNLVGIYLTGGSSFNEFSNNTIKGAIWGIHIIFSSSHNILEHNDIQYNSEHGIGILYSSTNNTVKENTFFTNEIGLRLLFDAFNNKIVDNVFYNSSEAIRSSFSGIDNKISFNEIYNNTNGIIIQNSNGTMIFNNTIHNNGGSGVVVVNSTLTEILNNTIFELAENGILVQTSFDNNISQNYIVDNVENGIKMWKSDKNIISLNNVTSNSLDGLFLYQSNYTEIFNNNISYNGENGITQIESFHNIFQNNTVIGNGNENQSLQILSQPGSDSMSIDSSGGNAIFMDPSSNNSIIGNTITGNSGNGILFEDINNSYIQDNFIFDNGLNGIYLVNSSHNIINNNTIYSNGDNITLSVLQVELYQLASSGGNGIFMDPSDNNTIYNNTIFDNPGNGLTLEYSNNSNVYSNEIYQNGLDGIFLLDSDFNTFYDNDIYSNGETSEASLNLHSNPKFGFYVSQSGGNGIFMDPSEYNIITNNRIFNNDENGIVLEYSSFTTISHNIIHDNAINGILTISASQNEIILNEFFGNGFGANSLSLKSVDTQFELDSSGGNAIFMDPSFNNTIESNDVYENMNGVYLEDSDYNDIINNSVFENYDYGISLHNSNYNNISDNDVYLNGGGGNSTLSYSYGLDEVITHSSGGNAIFMDPSDFNILSFNNISFNFNDAILLEDASFTEIFNNIIAYNEGYAIFITSESSNNSIIDNDVVGNNIGGTSQAYDDGEGNVFQSNYWSDHDNTDLDGDGIADTSYKIDGDAKNSDEESETVPHDEDLLVILQMEIKAEPDKLKIKPDAGGWYHVYFINTTNHSWHNKTITNVKLNKTIAAETTEVINSTTLYAKFYRDEISNYLINQGLENENNVTFYLNGFYLNGTVMFEGYINQTIKNNDESDGPGNTALLAVPLVIIGVFKKMSRKNRKDWI